MSAGKLCSSSLWVQLILSDKYLLPEHHMEHFVGLSVHPFRFLFGLLLISHQLKWTHLPCLVLVPHLCFCIGICTGEKQQLSSGKGGHSWEEWDRGGGYPHCCTLWVLRTVCEWAVCWWWNGARQRYEKKPAPTLPANSVQKQGKVLWTLWGTTNLFNAKRWCSVTVGC